MMTLKLFKFYYSKFLYGKVRHSIFSDRSPLGFLFQKRLDRVFEFPGLAYISHKSVCIFKFKNVIHITSISFIQNFINFYAQCFLSP